MKYIKTPVYEFSELDEDTKQKVIDRERTFYFDCMFEDDLNLWLFDSDKCPLINSGVSIDSLRDLSYDLSNYQYDHVAFRQCSFDINVLLTKSGAWEIIKETLGDGIELNAFVDNLEIYWRMDSRDPFCSSGEVIVDEIEDWEELFTSEDDQDKAYDLQEKIAGALTEYMHDLQQKLYDYLIELTDDMSSEENIIANLDSDLLYDSNGTSYTREEVEEE